MTIRQAIGIAVVGRASPGTRLWEDIGGSGHAGLQVTRACTRAQEETWPGPDLHSEQRTACSRGADSPSSNARMGEPPLDGFRRRGNCGHPSPAGSRPGCRAAARAPQPGERHLERGLQLPPQGTDTASGDGPGPVHQRRRADRDPAHSAKPPNRPTAASPASTGTYEQ